MKYKITVVVTQVESGDSVAVDLSVSQDSVFKLNPTLASIRSLFGDQAQLSLPGVKA